MLSGTPGREDHVIVVGAGIAGLACALRLAAAGARVTVLEAHGAVGGKMRTLPSPAGPVDAGPTVMTMKAVFEDLFAAAGIRLADHVTLVPERVLARHWWPDGSQLDLHADPAASAAAVRDFAGPKAEAQFRRFSAHARRLFDAFDAPMMQAPSPALPNLARAALAHPASLPALLPGRTLAGALKAAFDDPRLRQLFGRYATYVGGSPLESPALLSLIWQAEAAGVWRVEGGMHRLASALAGLIRERGGQIRLNAPVAEIALRDGAVRGVTLCDGTMIAAERMVYAGDPRALAQGRLGSAFTGLLPQKAVEPRSLSAHVLAFAARPCGPRATELVHHNLVFGRDPVSEFHDLAAGRPPADPTLYICAQDRGGDTATAPGRMERFEIIMNGPPTDRSATDPKKEGDACLRRILAVLKTAGLTFDPAPSRETLTTPAGFDRLFPGSAGALYGRSPHGMMAALARPRARTAVRGLYLAGGGCHPGAGIPMAALSGRHAAEAIATDRISTSPSRPTAMRGGMSTGSARTAAAPSR
ncbi:MAG: 1-hydroxycarotenoid 3,4-desaturase CrtD [Pseudomonadota bacterium]